MEERKHLSFITRIYDSSLLRLAAIVFIIALLERVFLDIIFFRHWGPHTVSGIELWFYYGVARGNLFLSHLDPTLWILKLLGFLFKGNGLFYSLWGLAALLSSLSATLLFLLVTKLQDKKTGFLAGIIYATMIQPLFNSTATFTHDLVAYPLFLLFLYCGVSLFTGLRPRGGSAPEGKKRLILILLLFLFFYLGTKVGPTILIALAAFIIYLIWQGIKGLSGKHNWNLNKTTLVFLIGLTLFFILAHRLLMPPILKKIFQIANQSRGIDIYNQLRVGCADLLPAGRGDFWLRFNIFLFFIPFALYAAFRKREILGFALTGIGLLAALSADRGIRPLCFGVAILVAIAFVNWEKRWYWPFLLLFPLIFFSFIRTYSIKYGLFFSATAILIFFILYLATEKENKEFTKRLALSFILGVSLVFGIVVLWRNERPKNAEAEYNLYHWLEKHSRKEERILVPWNKGYFVQAVSSLKAPISPANIDLELPKVYWMPEKMAQERLREVEIDYLLVSSEYFSPTAINPRTGQFRYNWNPGILYRPEHFGITRYPILQQTLLYRLLYDEKGLTYFTLLKEERDKKTKQIYRLYRIAKELEE